MRKFAFTVAALAALSAAPAFAATATNKMQVSVGVVNACVVSATPMTFTTMTSFGTANDATSDISVVCTNGAQYKVSLDNGTNSGGGSQRYMMKAGDAVTKVTYNVYTDALHNTAWDAATTVSGTGTGLADTIKAYGQIPSTQASVSAGSYTDTVTVTVTF